MAARAISLERLFAAQDARFEAAAASQQLARRGHVTAIQRHMASYTVVQDMDGARRIQLCRQALEALDRKGWQRSFHQRMFHEEYLKSCARVFFKRDGPGAFARSHNRVLELNSWDSTPQEILVSTPRRFGKTISVSMFAAAMVFACPNMELSIYSTCKRISQKLLRNIVKFLDIIFEELHVSPYKFARLNQEEVHVSGPEGRDDMRVINSYPSKIGVRPPPARGHIWAGVCRRVQGSIIRMALAGMYARILRGEDPPGEDELQALWQRWLWRLDCNEEPSEKCGDMNGAQVVGLLLCVALAGGDAPPVSVQEALPGLPLLHLSSKPLGEHSARELFDQLECLQLNWAQVLSTAEPAAADQVLRAVMARLGELSQHAYPKHASSPLDDPEAATQLPCGGGAGEQQQLFILTRRSLRHAINVMLAMFRVLHIVSVAEVVDEVPAAELEDMAATFKLHHLEASMDFFFLVQQMARLAPGMRLAYRSDFSGMYNDISQVIYFHYPKFARQPQRELSEIPESGIHTLPLALQLMPDIPVAYDDDTKVPGLTMPDAPQILQEGVRPAAGAARPPSRFCWLVTCGTVFLLDAGVVLASPDNGILPLMRHALRATGQSLAVGDDGRSAAAARAAASLLPPHAHAFLLPVHAA